jgi:hypothetical protein
MALSSTHKHISERETAHRWPDGQWDDSRWEDCSWDSAIEFARLALTSAIPATHAEAEALRDASGEPPTGGSNIDDVRRGLASRYRWTSGYTVAYNFTQLWGALSKGKVAVVQGSMGAFASSHPLRRWQPSYGGPHAVSAQRLDSTDNVWWCDPLAPAGTYRGQWVSKANLKRFVDALTAAGGRHLIARIGLKWRVSIHPRSGARTREFFSYTVRNGVITDRVIKRTGGFSASCTAPRTYTDRDPDSGGTAYRLVKITSGAFAGIYTDAKWAKEVPV